MANVIVGRAAPTLPSPTGEDRGVGVSGVGRGYVAIDVARVVARVVARLTWRGDRRGRRRDGSGQR